MCWKLTSVPHAGINQTALVAGSKQPKNGFLRLVKGVVARYVLKRSDPLDP